MKIAGIIAEYNPFHNGHLYQLEKTKEITSADYIVVIMSGDFVQRGVPAFLSKYKRAEMALSCGADLVIELPVRYAASSAEFFALGAISVLENLGTDFLCFGSECGNITLLSKLAKFIYQDCEDFNKAISYFSKSGLSFPLARKEAILSCFHEIDKKLLVSLLSSPNNILGIEYLKALYRIQSKMTPYTIQRVCTDYHLCELRNIQEKNLVINSASAIRAQLENAYPIENIKDSMPSKAFSILVNEGSIPVIPDDLSDFLFYKLQETTLLELIDFMDVSPDLARTIKNHCNQFQNFTQFASLLKSKQITQTRINRSLLHLVLNLKSYSLKGYSPQQIIPYIRVLGFKKNAAWVLRNAKYQKIPVITKLANAKKVLSESAYQILSEDLFATGLYHRMIYRKSGYAMKNEFLRSPIIF